MSKPLKVVAILLSILILFQWTGIIHLDLIPKPNVHAQEAEIKINFQPKDSQVPEGYLADCGQVYDSRNGYTYGWNTNHTAKTVETNEQADQRLDTFCSIREGGQWEIELASGSYDVTVSVGDAVYGSVYAANVKVEGIPFIDEVSLDAGEFAQETQTVEVNDGKLTVSQGSGQYYTPLNFIRILPNSPAQDYSVKLQMYNGNRTDINNTLFPWYKLYNTGDTPITLQNVKMRYYYTIDGEKAQNFFCDWSNVGSSNITGQFVKLSEPTQGADYYVEVGFTAGAGTLMPGDSLEAHTRVAKIDWSNYTQSNDYSFNSSATTYQDWTKAAVYIDNVLVWGDDLLAISTPTPSPSPTPSATPSATPSPTPTPTPVPTITPGTEVLRLQMYNANRNLQSNTIYPWFKLINDGTATMDLQRITIRYYYTVDGEKSQNYWCDWSNIGQSHITGNFVSMNPPGQDADYYLEIGFTAGAGTLAPGQIVEIQSRIAKDGWNDYNQDNDYSFHSSATQYVDWDKAMVYIDGVLVWGQETPLGTPTPQPTTLAAKVQLRNANRSAVNNTIFPWYKVVNTGDLPITLRNLKIRYYYTINGEKTQNFWCDWSDRGASNITGQFVDITGHATGSDRYFELGFTSGAGTLMPGESLEVQNRIAKTDWSDYIQTDDYSFDGSSDSYKDWTKVAAYLDGVLIWGDEDLFGIPQDLRTTDATQTSITLTWDELEGATGYHLEADGEVIDNGDSTAYVHTGLAPGTQHSYRVRGQSPAVTGNWSQEITKWTLPGVPQNIRCSATTQSITIEWDEVVGATSYEIEIIGDNVQIDTQGDTHYTHRGLAANTQKAYRIRAVNASGHGEWSQNVAYTTLADKPLEILAQPTDTTIFIDWDVMPGAIGYDIEVDGNIISVQDKTEYEHTGLLPNTQHTYRVRSRSGEGTSPWSEMITVTTLPSIPQNLNAVVTDTSITVSWDAVSGATGYDIEVDGTIVGNGLSTTYTHTDLVPNTRHTYRVRAKNGDIQGQWTDEIQRVTLLGVPQNISITASSTQIIVTWETIAGAVGYDIEVDGTIVDNGLSTTYTHADLVPNTRHTYRVRTRNEGGISLWSQTVTAATLLDVPQNITAAATSTSITLRWEEVPGATGYELLADGEIIENIQGSTYTQEGLQPNTLHIYRVRARADSFAGEWSETVMLFTIVGVPTNLSTIPSSHAILVRWNAVEGAENYDIEVDGQIIENIGKVTQYLHENLGTNTLHIYCVRAKNQNGTSAWSEKVIQVTAPAVPQNLKAQATISTITLTWDRTAGASSYDIETDGKDIQTVTKEEWTHEALEPNTRHFYRVRAKNEGGSSGWSEVLEQNTMPELQINAGKDNLFNFVVVAPKKEGVRERTIVVYYNPDELEVIDLCAVTPNAELTAGDISGTSITVESFEPGEIWYVVEDADKTVVNSIRFVAKINGHSKVRYVVE